MLFILCFTTLFSVYAVYLD